MSALYRKYRPRDFSEVVGQQAVVRTLSNAVTSGRVRHAYLFSGPRGTGKTSLAKILAKSLNCERSDGPTLTPCLECASCVAIHDATSLDVIELDAASNRGIDDIREIRDRVNVRPVSGRRKIYILDEAHSLTTDASNALLKTLEEPPDHAVFVLCTTESHKLLDTIKGRCQTFAFQRPTVDELREVLRRIAAAEQIDVDEDALITIARHGRGSFRDAVSTLDQLATAVDGPISGPQARELLGMVDEGTLLAAADLIAGRDAAAALRFVQDQADAGRDLGRIVIDLMGHLRLVYLVHQLGEVPASAPVTDETRAAIARQAEALDERTVLALVDGLLIVQSEVRAGGDPQLPLELLLIKATRPAADRSTDAILRRLDRLEEGGATPPTAPPARSAPAPAAASPAPLEQPAAARPEAARSAAPAAPPRREAAAPVAPWDEPGPSAALEPPPTAVAVAVAEPEPAPARVAAAEPLGVPSDVDELRRIWRSEVLPEVARRRASLAPQLAAALPVRVEAGALHVGYPQSAAFQRARADTDQNRRVVAEALTAVFGERLRVVFETLDQAAAERAAPAKPVETLPGSDDELAAHEDALIGALKSELDAHEVEEA